jgi:hypothetical protein
MFSKPVLAAEQRQAIAHGFTVGYFLSRLRRFPISTDFLLSSGIFQNAENRTY